MYTTSKDIRETRKHINTTNMNLEKNIEEYNPRKSKRTSIHRATEACKELKFNITANTILNVTPVPPWYDISNNTHFMNNSSKDKY